MNTPLPSADKSPPRAARSWTGVISLTLIAAGAALTVSQVAQFTAPQIERNRQLQATRTITAVLPGITYN
ncbi:MAG: hypothetical protein V2J12_06825, partial [Gammaproteobacteria bacterium]|nr:hypothetical protein [Gammaproteobacteria bacterium]